MTKNISTIIFKMSNRGSDISSNQIADLWKYLTLGGIDDIRIFINEKKEYNWIVKYEDLNYVKLQMLLYSTLGKVNLIDSTQRSEN